MSDVQRWVWTPDGMERYRAHPLMRDVGGVFVTAEDYAALAERLNLADMELETVKESNKLLHRDWAEGVDEIKRLAERLKASTRGGYAANEQD